MVRPHRSLLLFVRSERQTFSAPCAFRILLHFPCREEPRSVNRPASLKPDNFFLLIYRALRQRRIPLALRVVAHTLLLVALALIIYAWVMGMQFKQAMEQQADALGQSLMAQTAASATDLLVANDILSLNVLLSNLVKNPLVAHAAIYSVDNRVIAESGSASSQSLLGEDRGLFSTPISFQEVIAGHLRISLDMQQFQQPMTISLQSMGLLSVILLALTLVLSMRLGRQLSLPLMQLRLWLRDPDNPAPAASARMRSAISRASCRRGWCRRNRSRSWCSTTAWSTTTPSSHWPPPRPRPGRTRISPLAKTTSSTNR